MDLEQMLKAMATAKAGNYAGGNLIGGNLTQTAGAQVSQQTKQTQIQILEDRVKTLEKTVKLLTHRMENIVTSLVDAGVVEFAE